MIDFRNQWVRNDELRLFVRRAGSGQREPILFLHGFPESGLSWERQLRAFAPFRLVAALDGRGFGRSDVPPALDAYRLDQLVGDVAATVRALTPGGVTLVGHDWGGVVAWATAALRPELVERLIVVNAPHPTVLQRRLDDDPAQRSASGYISRLTTGPAPTPEQLWQATFGDTEAQGLISAGERAHLLASWRRPGAIEAMLNWYRAAPFDFGAVGGTGAGRMAEPMRVTVPALVIWGMDDTLLLPGLLTGLDALVADLTIERVVGAGHAILRERPEHVTSLIADYLATRSR
jgi:pimeloyl-ACP methyl ester carboxylesterase